MTTRPVRLVSRTRSPFRSHTNRTLFTKAFLVALSEVGADSTSLPLEMRLWFFGLVRMRPGGHAPFLDGELASTFANRHGVVYGRTSVQRALKRLKASDLLAPESTLRCLVYPLDLMSEDHASAEPCPVHHHADGWHRTHGHVVHEVFRHRPDWFQRDWIPDHARGGGAASNAADCRA